MREPRGRGQSAPLKADTPSDINGHLWALEALAHDSGGSVLEIGVRNSESSWALLHGLVRRRHDTVAAAAAAAGAAAAGPADSTARQHEQLPSSSSPFMALVDIDPSTNTQFLGAARHAGVRTVFLWEDDLTLDVQRLLAPSTSQGGTAVEAARNTSSPAAAAASHSSSSSSSSPSVGLIFVDTLHAFGQLKRELEKYAPFAEKYIAMHDTTVFGEGSDALRQGEAVVHAVAAERGWEAEEARRGLWPAIEEFLAAHTGEWALQDRFEHNNGLTVLRRVARGNRSSVSLGSLPAI